MNFAGPNNFYRIISAVALFQVLFGPCLSHCCCAESQRLPAMSRVVIADLSVTQEPASTDICCSFCRSIEHGSNDQDASLNSVFSLARAPHLDSIGACCHCERISFAIVLPQRSDAASIDTFSLSAPLIHELPSAIHSASRSRTVGRRCVATALEHCALFCTWLN